MEATVVVISGCSSGIGLAAAVLLAGDGEKFKVFATMRNLERKEELERAAGETLDKTLFIRQLDVSNEESVKTFAQNILKTEGKVDILINNAAYGFHMAAPEDVALDKSRQLFETNFFGAVHLTQQFLPSMKKRRSGHVMFITSTVVALGIPFGEMYTASKCALNGFAESLAPQLALFGIRVSTVCPGPVSTKHADNLVSPCGTGSDPETTVIREKFISNLMAFVGAGLQTQEEVALVIKKVIAADEPDLHNYTSEFSLEDAKKIFIDPSGNELVGFLGDRYFKNIEQL